MVCLTAYEKSLNTEASPLGLFYVPENHSLQILLFILLDLWLFQKGFINCENDTIFATHHLGKFESKYRKHTLDTYTW